MKLTTCRVVRNDIQDLVKDLVLETLLWSAGILWSEAGIRTIGYTFTNVGFTWCWPHRRNDIQVTICYIIKWSPTLVNFQYFMVRNCSPTCSFSSFVFLRFCSNYSEASLEENPTPISKPDKNEWFLMNMPLLLLLSLQFVTTLLEF